MTSSKNLSGYKKMSIVLGVVSAAFFFAFSVNVQSAHADEGTSTPPVVENTDVLCHNGVDDDGNFLIDASDPGCAPFFVSATSSEATSTPPVENTSELCHDGIDNNGNFLIDASDPDCSSFYTTATSTDATSTDATSTPPTTPPSTDSGSGGSLTGYSTPSGGGGSSLPTGGAVLGAFTSDSSSGPVCELYIKSYLRFGKVNDKLDVAKLQIFLNRDLGLSLPLSGFFDRATETAVKQLQSKYSDQILKPWVDAGLTTDMTPTGYVYKTTLWFINSHSNGCEGKIPFPTLR